MAPIYDSDVAEERTQQEEWKNYELWEKTEIRLKRNKRIWIISTIFVFLILSSVPVVIDRLPYWAARKAAVEVSKKLTELKRESLQYRKAVRVKFLSDPGLAIEYQVVENCQTQTPNQNGTQNTRWQPDLRSRDELKFAQTLEPTNTARLLLTKEICFDPVKGLVPLTPGEVKQAIAISSVNDLTKVLRFDRVSVVVLNGESAEISFN